MTHTRDAPDVLEWVENPRDDRGFSFLTGSAEWREVSYEACAWFVQEAAHRLVDAGVRPGDVVCCVLPNGLEFVATHHAILLAGATPCPMATAGAFADSAGYLDHAASVLRSARPSVVVTTRQFAAQVSEAVGMAALNCRVEVLALHGERTPFRRREPAQLALLQFTSGTTGTPRGVRVSQENLARNLANNLRLARIDSDSCVVTWLPMFHDMGVIGSLLSPVTVQADVRMMQPQQFIRSPGTWLRCFSAENRGDVGVAPCFGYEYATRRLRAEDLEGCDFSGWRTAVVGSDRVEPAALAAFCGLTAPFGFRSEHFVPAYGLAEATLSVTAKQDREQPPVAVRVDWSSLRSNDPVRVRESRPVDEVHDRGGWLTSCGVPDDVELSIVDGSGAAVPEGVLGEIRVSGASVADGYHGTPDSSGETFTALGLRTGDTGFVLGGELYVLGRTGDSVEVRGRTVYMEDVEAQARAATGLPSVRVCAFAGPTPAGAEIVVLVERKPGEWRHDLVRAVRRACGDQVGLVVLSGHRGSIHRTSSGKPRRSTMWRDYRDGRLAAEPVELGASDHLPLRAGEGR